MKEHHLIMENGSVIAVLADDIKDIGDNTCKIIGQQWIPIYKKSEVKYFYVKK